MANPRVHEVAKELGLTSKEVLAHLDKIGEGVKSHASTITEDVAARLKADLSGNGAAADKAPAKKTTAKKTTAAPKTKPTPKPVEPKPTPKAAEPKPAPKAAEPKPAPKAA